MQQADRALSATGTHASPGNENEISASRRGLMLRMAASHLRRLGHQVKLPASGSYRTIRSALKALEDRGYQSLADALDAMGLERIAPAAAIVGDVLMLPAEDRLGALVIALGNGRVVGYHEEAIGAAVLQPIEYVAAWRVS